MNLSASRHSASVAAVLALVAFAANSVLCRLALESGATDPAAFTLLRLLSGALFLSMMLPGTPRGAFCSRRRLAAALCLFLYAACFSFAYRDLATATGALILFGAVQLSLVATALCSGSRPGRFEAIGLAVALAGFVYLMLPGARAPSPGGFVLMTLSGCAWAGYTLLGRRSHEPVHDCGAAFVLSLVPALLLLIAAWATGTFRVDAAGALSAVASGALASGLGYVLWYRALPALSTLQAGVVQLIVPVLAGLGGALFLGETPTERTFLSAGLILGGIALAFLGRGRPSSGMPDEPETEKGC